MYVILQMISCGMTEDDLSKIVEPFDRVELQDCFIDTTVKMGLLENWCEILGGYSPTGWNYRSVKRFALRSGVHPDIIRAFQNRDWDTILNLPEVESGEGKRVVDGPIIRIGREMHALPQLLQFTGNMIQHDTDKTATVGE
jgi:hypothetical protein